MNSSEKPPSDSVNTSVKNLVGSPEDYSPKQLKEIADNLGVTQAKLLETWKKKERETLVEGLSAESRKLELTNKSDPGIFYAVDAIRNFDYKELYNRFKSKYYSPDHKEFVTFFDQVEKLDLTGVAWHEKVKEYLDQLHLNVLKINYAERATRELNKARLIFGFFNSYHKIFQLQETLSKYEAGGLDERGQIEFFKTLRDIKVEAMKNKRRPKTLSLGVAQDHISLLAHYLLKKGIFPYIMGNTTGNLETYTKEGGRGGQDAYGRKEAKRTHLDDNKNYGDQ